MRGALLGELPSPGEVPVREAQSQGDTVEEGKGRRAVGYIKVGRSPRGLYPVDDPADADGVPVAIEEDIARVEVPVHKTRPMGGGILTDDVDSPIPQLWPKRGLR